MAKWNQYYTVNDSHRMLLKISEKVKYRIRQELDTYQVKQIILRSSKLNNRRKCALINWKHCLNIQNVGFVKSVVPSLIS